MQFSIDDSPWTGASLDSDDNAVASGSLAGVAPGSHLVLASTNQAGVLLTALATVNVLPNSTPPPTTVYYYSISREPWPTLPTAVNSGYKANGDIVAYVDSVNGAWTLQYDNLDRLISTTQGPGGAGAISQYGCWGYDSFGNRTVQSFSDQLPSGATCEAASGATFYNAGLMLFADGTNRITGRSTASLTATTTIPTVYDGGSSTTGNITTDGFNGYLYDSQGHICAAHTAVAWTLYLYDAEGRRIAKTTESSTPQSCDPITNGFMSNLASATYYELGSDGDVMTEIAGGAWSHTDVSAGGQQIATYDVSGVHFQVTDWLGTRRVQTDYAGVPQESFGSMPFGECANCNDLAPDVSDKHYTGKERDAESGADYFGARYYASNMGRWMSPDWSSDPDPVPYADPEDPQSLNLYSYVQGNPLSNRDSEGHEKCQDGSEADACVTTNLPDPPSTINWDLVGQIGQRTLDVATQAAHQFTNIMTTPGGVGCMASLAAGGGAAGAVVGGGVGLAGLAGGGVAVVVTEPAGLAIGGAGGAASGLALGMTMCPGGAASGGGGRGSGSSARLTKPQQRQTAKYLGMKEVKGVTSQGQPVFEKGGRYFSFSNTSHAAGEVFKEVDSTGGRMFTTDINFNRIGK